MNSQPTNTTVPPSPPFSSLCSCEMMKFSPPAEISPTLERRLEDFLQKNVLVRLTLQKCQGTEWGRGLLQVWEGRGALAVNPELLHCEAPRPPWFPFPISQPLFLKHKPDAVNLFSFSDSLMFQLQEPGMSAVVDVGWGVVFLGKNNTVPQGREGMGTAS